MAMGIGQVPSWSNKSVESMNHMMKCQVQVLCIGKLSVVFGSFQ